MTGPAIPGADAATLAELARLQHFVRAAVARIQCGLVHEAVAMLRAAVPGCEVPPVEFPDRPDPPAPPPRRPPPGKPPGKRAARPRHCASLPRKENTDARIEAAPGGTDTSH